MSAHTLPRDFLIAPFLIPDPGNAGTIDNTNKGIAICALKTAGAETRTIPAPLVVGQELFVYLDTTAGNPTIAITSGSGVSSIVLDAAGDWFLLKAISIGGTVEWTLQAQGSVNSGATVDFGVDSLTIGGVKVTPYIVEQCCCVLNSACVTQTFFTADRAYQVTSITEIHSTLGTDAGAVNINVTKDTGTTAPGAGTALLTDNTNAGFNAKAANNTLQTGTLTGTVASLQMAAGDRLALKFAGTTTALAGVNVSVQLKPI